MKKGLEKVGKPELFNQFVFDKLFEQVDIDKTEKIKKENAARLLNYLIFKGL